MPTVNHRCWQEPRNCCKWNAVGRGVLIKLLLYKLFGLNISKKISWYGCSYSTESHLHPCDQWESHSWHRRLHIWKSRTSGSSRHQNTRELPLKQGSYLHQEDDSIIKHTNQGRIQDLKLGVAQMEMDWKNRGDGLIFYSIYLKYDTFQIRILIQYSIS